MTFLDVGIIIPILLIIFCLLTVSFFFENEKLKAEIKNLKTQGVTGKFKKIRIALGTSETGAYAAYGVQYTDAKRESDERLIFMTKELLKNDASAKGFLDFRFVEVSIPILGIPVVEGKVV